MLQRRPVEPPDRAPHRSRRGPSAPMPLPAEMPGSCFRRSAVARRPVFGLLHANARQTRRHRYESYHTFYRQAAMPPLSRGMDTKPLALVALLLFAAPLSAGELPDCPKCRKPVVQSRAGQPEDALDVLNRQRAARGLYAYVRDEGLTRAAKGCAQFRAERRIHLHTSNDFAALQPGVKAPVAGCAAWPRGSGFGACEAYSRRWRRCGAAWCVGVDGLVYCHAFFAD